VRSALLDVPGVTRAQVTLDRGEAIVIYDPRRVKVEALIAAVNGAVGPFGGIEYKAEVKEKPRPVSSR
jgi:copper chaperone CopZ